MKEILHALKTIKNGKSPGSGQLHINILKILEERYIDIMVILFNPQKE